MRFLRSCLLVLLALILSLSALVACKKEDPTPEDEDPCADGHTPGAWATVTPATQIREGLRQQVCSVCGAVIDSETTDKLEHDPFADIDFSAYKTTVDLRDYTLVYPDNNNNRSFSASYVNAVNAIAGGISAVTGESCVAYKYSDTPSSTEDPEIIVGVTDDPRTQALYESFEGHGYAICVVDNKILIQGTTNLLTIKAMQVFVQKYLTTGEVVQTVEIHNTAKCEGIEMVLIGDPTGMPYVIVRSDELDDNPAAEYGATYGREFFDYPVDAANSIKAGFESLLNLSSDKVTVTTDAAAAAEKEILIAYTNREDSASCLALLQGHEYGIFVHEGSHIVMTAPSPAGIEYATKRFMDYMGESLYYGEDGAISIVMPKNFIEIAPANEKWKHEFPKPELTLQSTSDANDDSLVYIYTGEGVNATAYTDYCSVLKQNGYSVLTENNNVQGSSFATLVNREAGISLYVAYNAFLHADELPKGEKYANAEPTLRIVSSNLDSVNLPTEQMLSFTPFQQARNPFTSLTAISMASAGTGYVMMLEDGSFIIMDGGTVSKGTEVDNVWNILSDLYEQAWGYEPSVDKPIRIAAWIISHDHGDHYQMLFHFSTKYGKTGLVNIEYVLGNFPAASNYYNTPESVNYTHCRMDDTHAESLQGRLLYPVTYIKVHAGQKLWFANVQIEVLFTHEEFYPHPIVAFNDSSTIVRLNVLHTDGESVTPNSKITSFIATGDLYRYGGRWLCAMYGDYLQSDMVALAHHAGPGAEWFFYTKVAHSVLWVPNNTSSFNSWANRSDWIGKANKTAATLASVKYIVTSNYYSSTHTNTTVKLLANGPDMEHAFHAGGAGTVTYGNTGIASGQLTSNAAEIGRR